MRNVAFQLMYNGTNYHGWQVQKNAPTVAETLEKALSALCGEKIKVTGCGRTDAGVHAERYIANFRTTSTIPCDRFPLAANGRLPEDIVVCRILTPSAPAGKRSIPTGFLIPESEIPSMCTGRTSIPSCWMRR